MRILIVGTSCAGKSTFARALASAKGLPAIELDELYWGANWTPKTESEFRCLVVAATKSDQWIVEGNYGVMRDVLWPQATMVIWLNYSFLTIITRALRRSIKRLFSREILWHANRESFRRVFLSKDSILLWVLTTFHRRRRELSELRARKIFPQVEWIEFEDPSDASRYLNLCAKSYQRDAIRDPRSQG